MEGRRESEVGKYIVVMSEKLASLTVVLLADGEADASSEEGQGEGQGGSGAAHHPGRCGSSRSSQHDDDWLDASAVVRSRRCSAGHDNSSIPFKSNYTVLSLRYVCVIFYGFSIYLHLSIHCIK